MKVKVSPYAYGSRPKGRIWVRSNNPAKEYDHHGDSLINMICINGVWVWIGEYYTHDYKLQKGIVVNTYA